MQHEISFGIQGTYTKVVSYLVSLKKIYDKLIQIQILRMQMKKKDFLEKIKQDWYLTAEEAVKENAADKIVNVSF